MNELGVIKDNIKETQRYHSIGALLNYDRSTACPPKAIPEEGELIAFVENKEFMSRKDEGYIHALLSAVEKTDSYDEWDRAMVKNAYRIYCMEKNLDEDTSKEMAGATQEAYVLWLKARRKNDFSVFRGILEKQIGFNRRRSRLRELNAGEKEVLVSDYDILLDDFEQGMTVQKLDALFEPCIEKLGDLVKKVCRSKKKIRTDFIGRHVPLEKQREISDMLVDVLGIDRTRFHIAETVHPFSDRMTPNDVRITTHYYENNFLSNIYSVLHESGHCMFDMWQPKEYEQYGLTRAKTLGMHESVSRFYENIIGRSESFVRLIYPGLKEIIPEVLEDVSERELYEAVNLVTPSPIRIEADELTYIFHIIIRYELEKDLFSDRLSVDDLPRAWNEKYQKYLGITPKDDCEGVLQDIHWTQDFGYFPTYALGNFYNAMYFNKMKESLDVDGSISKGDLSAINNWMIDHVYVNAGRLTPDEWIRDITGRQLTQKDFIDYLSDKYGRIFEL